MTAAGVIAAVAAAVDRGAPLTARDLLKFEGSIVRRLFDAGELVKLDLKRGRATETVIIARAALPVDDTKWTAEETDYLKVAYTGGVSFGDMERALKRPGGEILQAAWRIKLERGRRDNFGGEIPAWRVARFRGLLDDAYARGLNDGDSGADLDHRALKRAFAAGRAAAATIDRTNQNYSAREIERIKELRAAGWSVPAMCRELRRPRAGLQTKISDLGLGVDERWRDDEDRIIVSAVDRGLTNREIVKLLPGRSLKGVKSRAYKICRGRGAEFWTAEESDMLRAAVMRGDNLVAFAASIGRTTGSVRWRSRYLGLMGLHPKASVTFTAAEDRRIAEGWRRQEPPKEIADELGRTLRAVYCRAFMLGVAGTYRRKITQAEIEAVRAGAAVRQPAKEIAAALGVTLSRVQIIAKTHHIRWAARPAKEAA